MKQGGAFLAIILAISGILRLTSAGGVSRKPPETAAEAKKKAPHAHSAYIDDFNRTIQEFYGVWDAPTAKAQALKDSWNVPDSEELTGTPTQERPHPRSDVHFALAILPDPLHTRLALVFDRSIEAIQEAAERDGYTFDRAIFPWDRTPPPQPDDVDKRRAAAEAQKAAEEYPGLLIFRGPNKDTGIGTAEYPPPLFVFVVGETPTSGIRKKQFQNAVAIMKKIRAGNAGESKGDDQPPQERPLLILGPSSSGSLRSLQRELKVLAANPGLLATGETFVYSGTITDAASIAQFTSSAESTTHFVSFQENDDFIRDRFLQFACHDGFDPSEIATLSEGDTVYGYGVQRPENAPKTGCDPAEVVHLRFPREISYFRAAYQDKAASQQKSEADIPVPQSAPVTLSPEEIGTDDDAALPYAGAQTPATQEAVMVGILSELNKHHTKFTILYASDPLDQYFLTRYLRTNYPRGRVVVTTPDLLLTSQEDSTLRGVIGINTYPIVPGLSDWFCSSSDPSDHHHDDRLFVSSSSIGTFNAMLGLLAETQIADAKWKIELDLKKMGKAIPPRGNPPGAARPPVPTTLVHPAPYSEYASLALSQPIEGSSCIAKPLVWLTMLAEDGFWPIAGLSDRHVQSADRYEPILAFSPERGHSTEPNIVATPEKPFKLNPPDASSLLLPPAWKIAYCFGLFLLVMHMGLSLKGSILADSEPRAQFARIDDWRDVIVIALGALALETGVVTILFSGGPVVTTTMTAFDQIVLWLIVPIFFGVTIFDLGWLRSQKWIAFLFAVATVMMFAFQILAWFDARDLFSCRTVAQVATTTCRVIQPLSSLQTANWSTRVLHLSSGVSPVPPILFLAGAGYWWMWQSLRGVTLVDRRRPRLPKRDDPAGRWYRINDHEAAELRNTAHPFFFKWSVTLALLTVGFFLIPLVDLNHPVQTIEGQAYDRTYFMLLGLMIATLLGCLLKLVFTWMKCNQILSGLDRLPLRDAFSRMKHLSWHSLWNPGGSTLRATYKILRRGLDCLERLRCVLQTVDLKAPVTHDVRVAVQNKITETMTALGAVSRAYISVVRPASATKSETPAELRGPLKAVTGSPNPVSGIQTDSPSNRQQSSSNPGSRNKRPLLAEVGEFFGDRSETHNKTASIENGDEDLCGSIATTLEQHDREAGGLPALMDAFQKLQETMADTAAEIVDEMLDPWWKCDRAPVVSHDDRFKEEKLPLTRMLGEEFVALVYVNFLITVLLRMRTLVVTAIGMFVFVVLSMNVYPFEPHPALQTLAVTLLVVMGVAVGYVYAQMHRDPILSRLTSTTSGELGWDFWLKLASAGVIPVFSLLAVQFPEISRFLFSWLAPALQAIK
jgi:hypothetical protein